MFHIINFILEFRASCKKVTGRFSPSSRGGLSSIAEANTFLFSKRERITLRLLNAVAIPFVCRLSVVCLSVTLVHPTQAVKLFGNFFHRTIAQGLYFSGAKNRWWGTPLSP